MIAAHRPRARWTASTRSDSALDWRCSSREPVAGGRLLGGGDVIRQGGGAVDGRLPLTEQVEVGARQEQHDVARSLVPKLRRGRPGRPMAERPPTTSRPTGPSRTKVSPSSRTFLSRAMRAMQLVVVDAGGAAGREVRSRPPGGRARPPAGCRCGPGGGPTGRRRPGRWRPPRRGGGRSGPTVSRAWARVWP